MIVRIVLIIALLAAVFPLVSCFTTSHDFNAELSCDDFSQNRHRTDDFRVEIGDKIRVKLCSNPTTGFKWEYVSDSETVVRQEDHDFQEPDSGSGVGAGGIETWTFEAVEKGTTEVRLEYSRPWEGGEKAEWTYTMTVTVE